MPDNRKQIEKETIAIIDDHLWDDILQCSDGSDLKLHLLLNRETLGDFIVDHFGFWLSDVSGNPSIDEQWEIHSDIKRP